MELKGHFQKTVFRNESNGYTVALFDYEEARSTETVYVVGFFDAINPERTYLLQGDYVDHPKYGIQFKVESYQRRTGDSEEELIRYFASSQFAGIGPLFAKRIVDTLGLDAPRRIQNDPNVLDQVERMTPKRKKAILEGLNQEQDEELLFLSGHQLSIPVIFKLKQHYSGQLMDVLSDNPYQPMYDIDGIGFATMDKFALAIGIEQHDLRRLVAYSEGLLMEGCMRSGDSYLELQAFERILTNAFGQSGIDAQTIIKEMCQKRRVMLEEDRLYPISQYDAEQYIVNFFDAFPAQPIEKISSREVNEQLEYLEKREAITYEKKQRQAIEGFFDNDCLIITGGPGTGKTTIVNAIIALSRSLLPMHAITLVAPTGRAAKRMSELTGCEAKTIHSLLLWDKESGRFARNEENPINVDILIIDEFSMVDTYLFACLCRAGHNIKKMIMIGDQDQLPSVAMGALLRDLIACERFKVITLDKIYRQKEGSDIITLADEIKRDCLKEIPLENDIRFVQCRPEQIHEATLQVTSKALASFPTLEEGLMKVQVLVPKHKGYNGIEMMNNLLQKTFNPPQRGKRELKVGYRVFREGDKVLQLKNQPDEDVYNGDIGLVIEIIYASEDVNNTNRIVVDFEGRIVDYTSETFGNLTHAYCMSVHKAQGSEYPIVILPFDPDYGLMLQKRLIYTAVSRANRHLVLIGDLQAFYRGIHVQNTVERKTTLKERLNSCWGEEE